MRYMGGKSKIAKPIVSVMKPYINERKLFYEPFCGSAKITEQVIRECNSDVKIFAFDYNKYLIALFNALNDGWLPPKELPEEKYKELKSNPDLDMPLAAFAGFGCSWGGKWFGGYAKCSRGEDFALETHNSLLKQKDIFKDRVTWDCCDYKEIDVKNAVIYCDPPYANTTKYKINASFDNKEFWDVIRKWSKDNLVFISEYEAPDDFICIWSNEVKTELRNSNNSRETRIEKLFVYKDNQHYLNAEEHKNV